MPRQICDIKHESRRGGTRRLIGLILANALREETNHFVGYVNHFFLFPCLPCSPLSLLFFFSCLLLLTCKELNHYTRIKGLHSSFFSYFFFLPRFSSSHKAQAAEVIIGPGDVLYLPSYWFHYIVSLDRTVQCNSRAGETERGEFDIASCMRSHTTKAATGF